VTLFAFADGFAPFRVTAGPARLPAVVRTRTADPDSPVIAMTRDMECAANNWVRISGEIESEGAEPLCAMVLANGQHMFSCGASQGRYDLTVPADENGNVTVFGFADGFQPYSETFVAPECYAALSTTENGVEISAQITGGNYPFFGDCQLVITAKNTTTIIKDVAVFWDAWDSSGEAVGGPPASYYLRAGVTDTAYSWATYHDDKALDCGSISRLEFIEVSVDDVKMAR